MTILNKIILLYIHLKLQKSINHGRRSSIRSPELSSEFRRSHIWEGHLTIATTDRNTGSVGLTQHKAVRTLTTGSQHLRHLDHLFIWSTGTSHRKHP